MKLTQLAFTGWRNLQDARLQPDPGINLIWGPNAQGKTNLLESIYFLSTLKSFRARGHEQLVRFGGDGFHLRADVEIGGLSVRFEVGAGPAGRRLKVDGVPVSQASDYFRGLHVVLFTPDHLALVRGEPGQRRDFVDRARFGLDPGHLQVVRRYAKLLRERNAWLKQRPGDPGTLLEALDEQLAAAGAELALQRRAQVDALGPFAASAHRELAMRSGKELVMRYRSGIDPGDPVFDAWRRRFAELLAGGRSRDLRRGFTGSGPHQDDLELTLAGRPARKFASQGEARTIVLALKIAESLLGVQKRGEPPVFLLDDMGAELDGSRRSALSKYIDELQCQAFITSVDKDSFISKKKIKMHAISNGVVSENGF